MRGNREEKEEASMRGSRRIGREKGTEPRGTAVSVAVSHVAKSPEFRGEEMEGDLKNRTAAPGMWTGVRTLQKKKLIRGGADLESDRSGKKKLKKKGRLH